MRLTSILALCIVALVGGCASKPARIERLEDWSGLGEAYRLTNGTVELVVTPKLGRIMHYSFAGGPNVVWANAKAGADEGYKWWGGDKVWPWPQSEWGTNGWPPPPGTDPLPCAVKVVEGGVNLTSGEIPGYGVRLVREIRMKPKGAEVSIVSRYERVAEGEGRPVAVWNVTQVSNPDVILAEIKPSSLPPDGYVKMGGEFKAIERKGEMLVLRRNRDKSAKVGMDANLLGAVVGNVELWQKLDEQRTTPGEYGPGEKAQVYVDADRPNFTAAGIPPYIELEFTSPKKALRQGESVTLAVKWNLWRVE